MATDYENQWVLDDYAMQMEALAKAKLKADEQYKKVKTVLEGLGVPLVHQDKVIATLEMGFQVRLPVAPYVPEPVTPTPTPTSEPFAFTPTPTDLLDDEAPF